MDRQTALDRIIGYIYEGATDPSSWAMALAEAGRLTRSVCGTMQVRHDNRFLELAAWNLRPEDFAQQTLDRVAEEDEWSRRRPQPPLTGAVLGSSLIALGGRKRTRMWDELRKPFGMAHLAASMFLNDRRRFGWFSVWRAPHMRDYGEQDRRLFEVLTPHLGRAVRFAHRLQAAELHRQHTEQALDRLGFGFVLLRQGGRVLYANRFAEAILREGQGLTTVGGRLCGVGCGNASRLVQALCHAERRDPARSDGVASIARHHRRPLELWAMPLPRAERLFPLLEPVVATCVLLIDPERAGVPPGEALQALYGLTRTEARLAVALLQGERLEDYAERAAITLNTARSHLKSVFAKTDTNRQAGLIRLLSPVPCLCDDRAP
jgi:DNA-binding CsgD family transcriptional regulator